MKKNFVLSLAILFVLFSLSHANAVLLGISRSDGMYPDITINSGGTIDFTPTGIGGGTLIYSATDSIITYAPNDSDLLLNIPDFILTLNIDNNGAIVGTGSMAETLDPCEYVIIRGTKYGSATSYVNLLSGNVVAYGWDNGHDGGLARFDFLVEDLSGELVNNGIWPVKNILGTGIAGNSKIDAWPSETWWNDSDFTIELAESQKFPIPVPEPGATGLILFHGIILMILSGFGIKKRN